MVLQKHICTHRLQQHIQVQVFQEGIKDSSSIQQQGHINLGIMRTERSLLTNESLLLHGGDLDIKGNVSKTPHLIRVLLKPIMNRTSILALDSVCVCCTCTIKGLWCHFVSPSLIRKINFPSSLTVKTKKSFSAVPSKCTCSD